MSYSSGGQEVHLVADELAESSIAVILSPPSCFPLNLGMLVEHFLVLLSLMMLTRPYFIERESS